MPQRGSAALHDRDTLWHKWTTGLGHLPLAGIGCKQLVIASEREAGGRIPLCQVHHSSTQDKVTSMIPSQAAAAIMLYTDKANRGRTKKICKLEEMRNLQQVSSVSTI